MGLLAHPDERSAARETLWVRCKAAARAPRCLYLLQASLAMPVTQLSTCRHPRELTHCLSSDQEVMARVRRFKYRPNDDELKALNSLSRRERPCFRRVHAAHYQVPLSGISSMLKLLCPCHLLHRPCGVERALGYGHERGHVSGHAADQQRVRPRKANSRRTDLRRMGNGLPGPGIPGAMLTRCHNPNL